MLYSYCKWWTSVGIHWEYTYSVCSNSTANHIFTTTCMQVTTMALQRLASTTPRWVAASLWSWFSSAPTTPSSVTTSSPWPSPSPPQNTPLRQVCCHDNTFNWIYTLKDKVKGQNVALTQQESFAFLSLPFLLISFSLALSLIPALSPFRLLPPWSLLPPPLRPGNPGGAAGTCPWLLHSGLLCGWHCRGTAGNQEMGLHSHQRKTLQAHCKTYPLVCLLHNIHICNEAKKQYSL